MTTANYKVYIQPLLTLTGYGTNTDVTDYIDAVGVSAIMSTLDSYNFDIGVYRYNNLTLKGINQSGYFNQTGDLFTLKRDLAKVQVIFTNTENTQSTNFKGLIDERGTNFGINNDEVTFTVMSLDAVFSQVQVDSGDISNSDLFSVAIKAILNKAEITTVLNYDAGNINVDEDQQIDDVSTLINISVKDCLNYLLIASNSILYIDEDENIIVCSRTVGSTKVTFYGAGDEFGRTNILEIHSFTSGYSRLVNSVLLESRQSKNTTSITNYGLRQKEISMPFLTTTGTIDAVAANIVAEFKDPKKELFIKVNCDQTGNVGLLNEIELDLPDSSYNNINISSPTRWKLIGINEYPSNFTTDLHLREI